MTELEFWKEALKPIVLPNGHLLVFDLSGLTGGAQDKTAERPAFTDEQLGLAPATCQGGIYGLLSKLHRDANGDFVFPGDDIPGRLKRFVPETNFKWE